MAPKTSPLGMQCDRLREFQAQTDHKSSLCLKFPQSSHSHTANAGSLDSKNEMESRLESSRSEVESNATQSQTFKSVVEGGSESCEREGGERLRVCAKHQPTLVNLSPLPFSQNRINNRNEVAAQVKNSESGANEAIHNTESKSVESKEIESSGLPRSLATSRNDSNTETSDFDKNRNKINLHEVQQPQEALSEERVRVVREGEENDFAFVRSTNPHLQIQVSSPSLKVESMENPCEKDSNENENLNSPSLRESETNEAIHNTESKSVESSQKSKYLESNTDSKYAKHLDSRLDSHARLLQPSGFAMTESYNDKLTESRLPQNLATSCNDKNIDSIKKLKNKIPSPTQAKFPKLILITFLLAPLALSAAELIGFKGEINTKSINNRITNIGSKGRSSTKYTLQTPPKQEKPKEESKSQDSTKSTGGTIFFVGVDLGGALHDTKSKSKIGLETSGSRAQGLTFAVGGKVGVLSQGEIVGGRFYGEGAYFATPLFHILSAGVNLDLIVNFLNNKSWDFGVFAGLGGGMYMAFFRKPELDLSGKVPLSPIGWVNTGLRYGYGHHNVELTFKIPYLYASIYKFSGSGQINGATTPIENSHLLKASFLNISYVYYF